MLWSHHWTLSFRGNTSISSGRQFSTAVDVVLEHYPFALICLWPLRIPQHHVLDFTEMSRPEPFTRLIHLGFVYPLSITLTKKYNLFVKVELREDDLETGQPGMEVRW